MTKDEKIERLIELLIGAYPDSVGTREIMQALNITQQSARNYIGYLEERHIPVQEPESWRFTLNPADYTRPMRFSTAQAWFLYMLVRRVVRANLTRYASVNSVLTRLRTSIYGSIAEGIQLDMVTTPTPWDAVWQTLIDGWQQKRLVRVQYQAPASPAPTTLTIAPWSFEPAVWTDSHYVVGGVRSGGTFQPFMLKLDRIQTAALTNDSFDAPELEALLHRIDKAWGVWGGEGERVHLRFSYRVKMRVRETRWHPTQELASEEDGSLLWTAVIDEPRELMPWVRSWGADVEVMSPDWLRQEIAAEAMRTARLYGLDGEQDSFF